MQYRRNGGVLRTISKIWAYCLCLASNLHGVFSWTIFLSRERLDGVDWYNNLANNLANPLVLHNVLALAGRIVTNELAKYLYVSSFLIMLIVLFPFVASGVIERAWQLLPYSPISWLAFLILFIAAAESVISWLPNDKS